MSSPPFKIPAVDRIAVTVDRTSCSASDKNGSCAMRSLSASTRRSKVVICSRCCTTRAAHPRKRPANSSTRSVSITSGKAPLSAAASCSPSINGACAPSVKLETSTLSSRARSTSNLPPILRRLCSIRLRYAGDMPTLRAKSACLSPSTVLRSRMRVPVSSERGMFFL